MSWRVVCASEVGTSHSYSGVRCQDSSWASVDASPNNGDLLSIFVSDGAGSASKGGEGADLAIEAATAFISEKTKLGGLVLSASFATDLVQIIRMRIGAYAELHELKSRDFACTFLGVLSCSSGTLVFQIGDGGIVLDFGAGLEVPVEPMTGEYANMTNFVTDDNAIEMLASRRYPSKVLRAAAFSDGLQRLALDIANNTAYEPFFKPFFDGLAKSTAEQEEMLQRLLSKFLQSQAVNERTDDDKSLALAVCVA
jgi:hypothetical protein